MEKLKLKEKIGYGLGDAASSMFWKLFSMYLLFFYTDVFGIPAATAGTMFLLTRIWDAANDPIMGIIADRTSTRWGKFRPYLLWMALPFTIIGVLLFTTPALSLTGKIIYAYITYSLMMMVYTGINVPYASLMGVMTSDSKQRTSLSSFRMLFAFAGSILVLATFQPLFDSFGARPVARFASAKLTADTTKNTFVFCNEIQPTDSFTDSLLVFTSKVKITRNEAFRLGFFSSENEPVRWIDFPLNEEPFGLKRDGTWSSLKIKMKDVFTDVHWMTTAPALHLAVEASDLHLITLQNPQINEINYQRGTQRAVMVIAAITLLFFMLTFSWTKERVKPVNEKNASIKADFKDLLHNGPWFILLGAGVATLIFNSIRDGAAIYYFRYFLQNESATELKVLGMALPIAYSTLFLVLGQAANIVGVIAAKPVSDKIGKRGTFLLAMSLATVLSLTFYLFDQNTIVLIFVFQFFISVCAGSVFPLLWSMYADIADYSEWRTGRRATGLIFSSSSMSQKLGWTLGGAVTGWLLAFYGFKADVVQSAETQNAIRLMLSVFPAVGAVLSVCFIYIYKLNDQYMAKINDELNAQRK